MKKNIYASDCFRRLYNFVRLLTLSFTLLFYSLSTNAAADEVRLSLSLKGATLPTILKEIKEKTQYDFMYNSKDFDTAKTISVELKNVSLDSALKVCIPPFGLTYAVKDKIIVLRKKQIEIQQNLVKGYVKDVNGEGLPGVAVTIKGTTYGAATDVNGNFELKVPKGEITLLFTFVGMKPVTRVVNGDQTLNVTLEDSPAAIEEVIVTGMGSVKKDQATGSLKMITAKDLRSQGINSIDRILEGMIPGLNSTTISGAPGARAKITIRGENNLSGRTEPLWIVDGLPLMSGVPVNNTGDYAGTIMQDGVGNIMPEEIESVTILKDAAAAAIYGARAANGVIVITTKKGFRSKTQFTYSGNFSISDAPRIHIDFMNSAQKLKYEVDIVKNFGFGYSYATGRGGRLYQRFMQGYITEDDYNKEMDRLKGVNTDWFDVIFRKATSHSHNVSIRGGSEEMTYYTSISFQERAGILSSNKYSNAGLLVKMDYRPIKNLIIGLDLSVNVRKNRDNNSAINPFTYAVFANTYERPFDEKGNYASDLSYLPNNAALTTASGYKYDSFNILRELKDTRLSDDGLDAYMTFTAKYDIMPGFSVQSIVRKGVSYNTKTQELNAGTYASLAEESFASRVFSGEIFPSIYNNGMFSESSGKNFNWSIRNQIDYSYQLKDHLFTALLANEIMSKVFNNFSYKSPIYYGDYRIVGIPDLGQEATYDQLNPAIRGMFSTSVSEDRTVSFLGSFRYSFKDKYIVDFTYRADGANAIGKGNRFSPLWSTGVRYNLHKEEFFKNDVLTEMAFRGSFGYTANIDRTAYPFATMELGPNFYQGNRFATEFTYPNPSVRWEKKREVNYGIDLTLFDNRINFTMDGYFNRTKDVLEDLPVPISSGRSQVRANGGIVENSGIEFYLNVRWINTTDMTFSTSANVARNKNVIVRSRYYYNSYKEAIKYNVVMGGEVNVIGTETGSIYGWKRQGTDPITGNPTYYLTEDAKIMYAKFMDSWDSYTPEQREEYIKYGLEPTFTGLPDYMPHGREMSFQPEYVKASMQYLGRRNPKYVGGFNTYFRYKGLEFTSQWSYKIGNIIPSFNDYQNAPNNGDSGRSGYSSDLAVSGTNREARYQSFWLTPGDNCQIPRFVTSGNDYWAGYVTSDKYEKGDYLRLLNVALSYRLPVETAKMFGMRSLSVSVNAYNLLTFTKYKGLDVGNNGAFAYPVAREYNLKLSVGF